MNLTERKSQQTIAAAGKIGGGGGIRTPVGLHPNGFQDCLVFR